MLLGAGSQTWCQSGEQGPIVPSITADCEERRGLGHLTAEWGLGYRKIEIHCFKVWNESCKCLSGPEHEHWQAVCFSAVSGSAVMVRAPLFLCMARFTVMIPNLQSDLHQNSRR